MPHITEDPNHLLAVVLGFVWMVLSALAAVGMLALVRRLPVAARLKETNDVAGYYVSIVSTLYAVLLAMMFFATWNRYELAEDVCAQEASELVDIYQVADGLSEPGRTQIRTACRDYTDLVIQKEFPAMQSRKTDDAIQGNAIAGLNHILITLNPPATHDQTLLSQELSRFQDMVKNRNSRLHKSESDIPALLWVMVFIGGFMTVGLSCLFWMDHFWLHTLKLCLLASIIGLVVYAMWAIDDPYEGELYVSAHDFTTAREMFQRDSKAAGKPSPPGPAH